MIFVRDEDTVPYRTVRIRSLYISIFYSALPSALIGKSVPANSLPGLNNPQEFVTFPQTATAPYLVNYFASWCAPCRAEAPSLALISEQMDIVGIAYKDKAEDTRTFLQSYGNPYRVIAMDSDGQAGLNWGVYGVPETYLISADGKILLRHAGPLDMEIFRTLFLPEITKLKSDSS